MPSIMSFELFIVPATMPYTMPGTRNRRKISDTIDRIIGAVNAVRSPSGERQAEPAGNAVANRTTMPMTIEINAQRSPRTSLASRSCISGRSSASPSISVLEMRGSTILSVMYQPKLIISTDEIVVKK